jgi:hypothetical protein
LCLALRFGAPLLYTSSLKEINTDLLLGVLTHLFFGLPIRTNPEVIYKLNLLFHLLIFFQTIDMIYTPFGWDSVRQISTDVQDVEETDAFMSVSKELKV